MRFEVEKISNEWMKNNTKIISFSEFKNMTFFHFLNERKAVIIIANYLEIITSDSDFRYFKKYDNLDCVTISFDVLVKNAHLIRNANSLFRQLGIPF